MNEYITKLIERLKEIESKILDVQYEKTATTNTIERCDAQLRLIEKLKKEVNQLAEEYKADTNDCYNDFISRTVLIDKL